MKTLIFGKAKVKLRNATKQPVVSFKKRLDEVDSEFEAGRLEFRRKIADLRQNSY